jgi:hypothetical protein
MTVKFLNRDAYRMKTGDHFSNPFIDLCQATFEGTAARAADHARFTDHRGRSLLLHHGISGDVQAWVDTQDTLVQ